MKLPLSWIKEYADVPVAPDVYRDKMIMAGNGIESVEETGGEVSNVAVGQIKTFRMHPNSNHLTIVTVDVGDDILQIVTGAPNITEASVGAYVPVARHGATLPGGKVIRSGKLRGEASDGMLCGGDELGVPESLYPGAGVDGILIFNEPHPLGMDVKGILGIDDTVFDFEVLANRPDCLSAWGIARETAAVLGTSFAKPEITVRETAKPAADFATVEVLDTDLAPRYAACAIANVRVAPSPMWLRKALHGAGMRSINNIVDITNYVMLETGHPMHAFDLDRVRDQRIIVRRAKPGEKLTTLDGKERELTENMLVISDAQNATGLAGIMGGEESEITEATRTLLFECAAFDRTNIRLTSRALGMRTEASARFEKGVSPYTIEEAMGRACQLVNLLDAGDVAEGMIDLYPNPKPRPVVEANCDRMRVTMGVDVPDVEMVRILKTLHFDVTLGDGVLTVIPPEFRQDVEQEADLTEEVLRIYGYQALRTTLPVGSSMAGQRSERMRLLDSVKGLLRAWGGFEIYRFSFMQPSLLGLLNLDADDPRLQPLNLRNYLGEDTSVMRSTLVPSMLTALALNQSRKLEEALLYEAAAVFETVHDGEPRKPGDLPWERQTLCIGAYGAGNDFYRIRGIVEALLASVGIKTRVESGADNYYHPGRAACLIASDGTILARLGEVHPDVSERFECAGRVYLAELDLDAVRTLQTSVTKINEPPRHPAVTRDIALVVDDTVQLGVVRDSLAETSPLVESVKLFDVYRGAQVGDGRKSAAFALTLRALDRTLTDADVNPVIDSMLVMLKEKFGAELRA
ncbi:phenylalanine--tRNA ligase beta subunit [Clostridia bacterium]|nr:phenylalanine--tRNA ligase beta subunit [Clostridia bacterium]